MSCVSSSISIRAHVGVLARAPEKSDVDERPEQRLHGDGIKAPQPLCLLPRQRKAGDLDILGAYELQPIGDMRVRWQHMDSAMRQHGPHRIALMIKPT